MTRQRERPTENKIGLALFFTVIIFLFHNRGRKKKQKEKRRGGSNRIKWGRSFAMQEQRQRPNEVEKKNNGLQIECVPSSFVFLFLNVKCIKMKAKAINRDNSR